MATTQEILTGLGFGSATNRAGTTLNADQLAANFHPDSLAHFNSLDDAGKKSWLTASGFSPVSNTPSAPTAPPVPNSQEAIHELNQPQINGQTVDQFAAGQVTNPTTPAGTTHVGSMLQEKEGEIIDPNVTNVNSPTGQAAQGTAAQADPNAQPQIQGQTYEASQGEAAQGTVDPRSTMQGQLASLYDQVKAGNAPWADAAIRRAEAAMNARGMGASTMAGAAIAQSIMEAAIPIAEFDAKTFGEMNLQNLRNRQEAMLTNTAAENAAKQFNATSVNDINKFMSEMTDRLFRFNVEQKNAMETFNTDQHNSMKQFYDKMQNETDKFIAQNKLDIAKSNAEWRRAMNLANTATENAVNFQNVQNRFNMSQQAVADLWQRSRDVFNWAQTSAENAKDRAFRLSMYSLQREDFLQDVDDADRKNLFNSIGNIAFDIFDDIDVGDIFGGSDPGPGNGDPNFMPDSL